MYGAARILGFGHSVPERRVLNDELEGHLGLHSGWIEARTGIHSRFWARPADTLSGLAADAGEMALAAAGVAREAVGLLLLATSTPDHLLPPSAPRVAHRLGLCNAGGVDLAGACAGFIYALTFADGYVRLHGKHAIVIAANILSRRINLREAASASLFADAAGAVVLAPSDDAGQGILGASLASDGAKYELIHIPAGGSNRPFSGSMDMADTLMTMRDGRKVFVEAIDVMSRCSAEALAAAGFNTGDITRFVPHQANGRIVAAIGSRLGIVDGRIVRTFPEYGNSSAATIPLSLSLVHLADPLRPGEKVLLAAVGAGLTGGALVLGI